MTQLESGLIPARRARSCHVLLLMLLVHAMSMTGGCAKPQLAPTPNLYLQSGENPFADLPPELQTPYVEIIYATDRNVVSKDASGSIHYGTNRSQSLTIGTCRYQIGENLTWDQLVEASNVQKRSRKLHTRVDHVVPMLKFAPSGRMPASVENGRLVDDPNEVAQNLNVTNALRAELSKRLALTPRKDVFLYVHGFNNSLEEGVTRIAELWHFMGRVGVPVAYSWPAGSGGVLRGYTRDRESGEFTVYHLKQFIRALAACPEVERIHFIGHSRGADVLCSALRELVLECNRDPFEAQRRYKAGNLVLAAPDLDLEVTNQRMVAERTGPMFDQVTMYINADDKAIGISGWLFNSMRRIGELRLSDLPEDFRKAAAELGNVALVDVHVKADFFGHGYFISNPAVLSDMILLLRDNRRPGVAHGRPLQLVSDVFWELHDGYPHMGSPAAAPATQSAVETAAGSAQ